MELLRFLTCGSVDDGKSTLIGRLLYDSNAVQVDLLEAIQKSSAQSGDERVNLALLTDGLKAEREQGITIDVAYKYFSTDKRKFIIADTPGHIQYTRNMITGASTAQLSVLLVDARFGIVEQTRRHTYISAMMGLPHILLCINKMDLVEFKEDVFDKIRLEFRNITRQMGIPDTICIPICALDGDNVVNPSKKMDWYSGPTFLKHLEGVNTEENHQTEIARLPVQYVIRPRTSEYPDYRAYAGQIATGVFRKGDRIKVYPSGLASEIEAIDKSGTEISKACGGDSIALRLKDNIDISRGDLISGSKFAPEVSREFTAEICWMSDRPLQPKSKFILQINNSSTQAMIQLVDHRINIHTLQPETEVAGLEMNDIGRVHVKTATAIAFDSYLDNEHRRRSTGAFILIDEINNDTMAAGIISNDN